MKKYVLFAGVNGAGKTTLYQTDYYAMHMQRVNVDEIVRSIGVWDNPSDVMKAGKIAAREIKHYLAEGISFNQETTLCGRSILQNIKLAKEKGFFIEVFYVGLESAEIAKNRVKHRVLNGGHGVSEQDIERRYKESLKQLKRIAKLCDTITFFDNTSDFRQIGTLCNGKVVEVGSRIPKWCHPFFDINTELQFEIQSE